MTNIERAPDIGAHFGGDAGPGELPKRCGVGALAAVQKLLETVQSAALPLLVYTSKR